MDLEIRFFSDYDIDDVITLLYQVHKVHSDKRNDLFKVGAKKYEISDLKSIIKDRENRPVFVAIYKNKVIGYAFCIKQEIKNSNNMNDIKTLYIDDLCVDENCRGLHIGTSLYNHVIAYAKENNYYNIALNVWTLNTKAFEFYKKLGLNTQKIGMEKIL